MNNNNLDFEWDDDKAATNLKKHGVSFDEATTVFGDPYAQLALDESHSDQESRQIAIGMSNRNRVLFVAFIEQIINVIRIISARKTTPTERKQYEEAN